MIAPGFIVGIVCLMMITYRTILAFFNENKVILININKYGEQYLDIVALGFIWSVILVSLFFLVKTLRKESYLKKDNYRFQERPDLNKENYFFDLNSRINLDNRKTTFIGYISESNSKVKRKFKEK